MNDIGSFYEAASVEDAIRKLQEWPDAEIISGGSDVLIKIREGRRRNHRDRSGKEFFSYHGASAGAAAYSDAWICR